jgi:hypothetical protein
MTFAPDNSVFHDHSCGLQGGPGLESEGVADDGAGNTSVG